MKKTIYVFLSLLLLVTVPTPKATAQSLPQGKGALRVMTYNVYQGTNFTAALGATTPTEFLLGVGTEFSQVRATNPPERMKAVAKQIVAAAATLVSLQEVSTWSSGPFNPTTFQCGELEVEFDMLQELLAALAAEGAHYQVAVQAPMFDFPPFPGLILPGTFFCAQLSNYVVILTRSDINENQFQWSNPQSGIFDAKLFFPIPGGGTLPVPRAWASLDGEFHGRPFRFIASHLESGEEPIIVAIRQQQGDELRDGPAHTSLPVIIAFDSNARADPVSPDPTYTDFLEAGYSDVWSELAPDDPGLTWGQSPTVDNPVSELSERIDLILTLGDFNPQRVAVFGATTDSMTPEGLWPSDHAGVAAQLGISGQQIALPGGGP
jgi:hypothetical protein